MLDVAKSIKTNRKGFCPVGEHWAWERKKAGSHAKRRGGDGAGAVPMSLQAHPAVDLPTRFVPTLCTNLLFSRKKTQLSTWCAVCLSSHL